MKNSAKLHAIQREYIHKLLSDHSIDDKMPLFTKATEIFEHIKKSTRKKKR